MASPPVRPDPATSDRLIPADWFARDEFWREAYPILFPPEKFDAAWEEASAVLRLAEAAPGRRLVDLGCGPGRHAVAFAKKGFAVTGVDLSSFLLERARALARREGVEVEWVRADLREWSRPGGFDLAVSLFTSFGYFESADEQRRLLANAARSLAPGGLLVMDLMGKEIVARHYEPTVSYSIADGSLVFERRRILDAWRRLETDWHVVAGGTLRTRLGFRLWLYAASELAALLDEAGLEPVRLCGDWDGAPYGPDARRLIAVARRRSRVVASPGGPR